MAAYDNAWSRWVFWLKILLPLAALGILSTIFLVAHTIDPSRAIPYAKVDVTRLVRDSRITLPVYAGVTADGGRLAVTAAEAQPDAANPGRTSATRMVATLTRSGGTTTLTADHGLLNQPASLATFDGNARLDSSADYHMRAPHMEAKLDNSSVLATGGVTGTAPFGTITSDRFEMTANPAAPGTYVLVFTGGVKLIYRPQREG